MRGIKEESKEEKEIKVDFLDKDFRKKVRKLLDEAEDEVIIIGL